MKISAGIAISDGKVILLGHATGNAHWDIPKGAIEDGETSLEAALRETKEEFDIDINPESLFDCGVMKYNKEKKIHLFICKLDSLPDENLCKCNTFFDRKGKRFPEMDKFQYFDFNKGYVKMAKSMKSMFDNYGLFKKIEEI